MKIQSVVILFLSFLATSISFGQSSLALDIRIIIEEAKDISYNYGSEIWEGFNNPPFSILLIGEDTEFLIDHYYQPDNFSRQSYDTIIHSTVHQRPSVTNIPEGVYDFHGLFTAVIAIEKFVHLNQNEKILLLLKHRTKQYLFSSERYFLEAEKLLIFSNDLRKTGRFDYPLQPFTNKELNVFKEYITALILTVDSIDSKNFENIALDFFELRTKFKNSISNNSDKYIEFIKSQEGIIDYTQFKFLQIMERQEMYNITSNLFYTQRLTLIGETDVPNPIAENISNIGFMEAILLDQLIPWWREKYHDHKHDLSYFFDQAKSKLMEK